MKNDGKKWFIFRHFGCFYKFYAKNLNEAKLMMFCKRRQDFYYFKFVAEVETKKEAIKYRKENVNKPYIKLK